MPNRGEAGLTGGPDTVPGARGQIRFKPFQKFKLFQKQSNFSKYELSKFDLLELQKFGIKYRFEDLKEMNNFLHRIFFRFGMGFK
jgi:hypothetical protein